MIIRFRLACLKRICTGLFFSTVIALVLPGCSSSKPEVVPLPGGIPITSDRVRPDYGRFGYEPAKTSGRTEELWILARGETSAAESEQSPGSGTLRAKIEDKEIPMPLKHTDVRAWVSGYIGTVEVSQQFSNPYSS